MCLEAILESGHGTASAPFLSTYPWDCYDVLRGLDVQPRGQRLVNRDHLWCDVVTVAEGDEYWFGLPNFYTITRYNRSVMYAMAVNQLAELLVDARGQR